MHLRVKAKYFFLIQIDDPVVEDSCEQSGVNTIESLQGFHPLLIGEFWPPFLKVTIFNLLIKNLTLHRMLYLP